MLQEALVDDDLDVVVQGHDLRHEEQHHADREVPLEVDQVQEDRVQDDQRENQQHQSQADLAPYNDLMLIHCPTIYREMWKYHVIMDKCISTKPTQKSTKMILMVMAMEIEVNPLPSELRKTGNYNTTTRNLE